MSAIIEIKKLKKHFGKIKAVDGIDITVEKGEIFGFLGPNGAGKTTTIRCLMDFLRPTSGEIKISGLDSKMNSSELKKQIGFLPGNVRLYESWTGAEHISFIKSFGGKEEIANELIKRLDFNPKMRFKNLSSGNKQKLGLILALMKKPEILILDEPTNALDPLLQNLVHKILREWQSDGLTIFMSSHNLSEVEQVCSRVGIIKDGKMVAAEDIRNLKAKRMHYITVSFDGDFEQKDFQIAGVESLEKVDHGLVIKAKGDIDAIVKQLAKNKIKDLEISRASLEEIFLEFYNK